MSTVFYAGECNRCWRPQALNLCFMTRDQQDQVIKKLGLDPREYYEKLVKTGALRSVDDVGKKPEVIRQKCECGEIVYLKEKTDNTLTTIGG